MNYLVDMSSMLTFLKRKSGWLLFILLAIISSCEKDDQASHESVDILEKIQSLPGVQVSEIEPYYGYPRAFQIDFLQPVDHNIPEGQQFNQRIYLSHVDESLPMVFGPSGYGSSPGSVQEIAGILQTNHLAVVHRYFIDARPDTLDWQYLTIRLAAMDHHRIVNLFKQIYENVWISSGVSKGGLTCLFHKRFFPDDVDATIAYVAPIIFGTSDHRFIEYQATIGSEDCRNKIHSFQRRCLNEKDSIIPRMQEWFEDHSYTLSGDPEMAIESGVRSYDWNFWQYHVYECSDIPEAGASYEEMTDHLITASKMFRSSDELTEYFKPYYYQAFTEIGYPKRNYDHIIDMLKYDPDSLRQTLLNSYGDPLVYNPLTIQDIHQWLVTQGDNIIYIYGSIDPWSGGQIVLTEQADALKIMQEGEDHGVTISDLDEQDLVLNTLEKWLNISIDMESKGIRQINLPDEEVPDRYTPVLSVNY
jgi:hypothetical protein